MIDRIYYRAGIYISDRGLVGWASAKEMGECTGTEAEARHTKWEHAEDSAEMFCNQRPAAEFTYVLERVTVDVERMMEGPE